ncbi:MAG: PIN domain-containing protein [Verrucomicrobiota bacterium]
MRVLVDTSVWSLALRRRNRQETPETQALEDLISDGRAVIIGPVRQEILSGVRYDEQFQRLKLALDAFPDLLIKAEDYVEAAQICNRCLESGFVLGNTDCLIAAIARRENVEVLTTDNDFKNIASVVSLGLFGVS